MSKVSTLILRHNTVSDTIELHFVNEDLKTFLSSLPPHFRTWNPKSKCWVIVPEILNKIVSYSRHLFTRIDSSSLPVRHQTIVQRALQGLKDNSSIKNEPNSPYATLYVTQNAPKFVIKAAYKALAFQYHPDRGGNSEEFQRVREAYDKIVKGSS